MSFPGYPGKHDHDSFISPAQHVAWHRRRGALEGFTCPEAVVMLYQPAVYRAFADAGDATPAGGKVVPSLRLLGRTGRRVGVVGGFGIGAPAAAAVLEQLIALGVGRFISVGWAGALQPGCRVADMITCTGAVRDEGLSHHYLAPGAPAEPDPALTARLHQALSALGHPRTGTSWTIDAPYRETATEVAHYRSLGVATVEMEAAALFAVATVRRVPLAAAFCVSDLLDALEWDPQFDAPAVLAGTLALAETAVTLLAEG